MISDRTIFVRSMHELSPSISADGSAFDQPNEIPFRTKDCRQLNMSAVDMILTKRRTNISYIQQVYRNYKQFTHELLAVVDTSTKSPADVGDAVNLDTMQRPIRPRRDLELIDCTNEQFSGGELLSGGRRR